MINRDDMMLQTMIQNSQFGEDQEFWFSRTNQKKYVFAIGAKLIETNEIEPNEAVELAQEYVDAFYARIMDPNGWKGK